MQQILVTDTNFFIYDATAESGDIFTLLLYFAVHWAHELGGNDPQFD